MKSAPDNLELSTDSPPSSEKSDYIEFRIPKFSFSKLRSPIGIICLMFFSFLLGMYTTKVQYLALEKRLNQNVQGASTNSQQQTIASQRQQYNPIIKQWASQIGLSNQEFTSCFDGQKYQSLVASDQSDGNVAGVNSTPTFFINGHKLVGALPIESFQKAINFTLNNGDWNNPDASVTELTDGNADNGEIGKTVTDVSIGHLPILGKREAKVVMIEFGDFQCPFCNRFYTDTLPTLKQEYINTGKVAFYYREYPLPAQTHPLAEPFANAAECANAQGEFWQMHDKLFSAQS